MLRVAPGSYIKSKYLLNQSNLCDNNTFLVNYAADSEV